MNKIIQELAAGTVFPSDAMLKVAARDAKAFKVLNAANKYSASDWTETTSGTGAAIADDLSNGGGVLLTAGSTSGKEAGVQSAKQVAPLSGQVVLCGLEFSLSHASNGGFYFGMGNVQADPKGTFYTNFIGLVKATGAATMIGRVSSGSAASSGTLATLSAGLKQYCVLLAKLDGSGGFFNTNGTVTAFTTDQITQLGGIPTTPPTDWSATLHAFGSSGNPALTARAFWLIA